jgi:hypothetical protein
MRRASAVSVLALASAVTAMAVGPAQAKAPTASTTVTIQRVSSEGSAFVTYGILDSSSRKCLANRKVKVYYDTDPNTGPFKLVDTARTSDNGEWAGYYETQSIFRVKAVATETKVGRRHHRLTCLRDASPIYIVL